MYQRNIKESQLLYQDPLSKIHIKVPEQKKGSPSFHVSDHTQVVLVPPNSSLNLMKQVAQLHKNHQARHWQPDIAKQLWKKTERWLETNTTGNKRPPQETASGLKRKRNQETSTGEFFLSLRPFRLTTHVHRYYYALHLQLQLEQHSIYNDDKLYSVLFSLTSPAANENNSVWYYPITKLIKHLLNR